MYAAVWIHVASAFCYVLHVVTHQLSNPRPNILFRTTVYLLHENDIRLPVPEVKGMVVSLDPSDPSLQ